MILGPHTVTRLRPGTKPSGYGSTTQPDWGNTTSLDITGCSVQPVLGGEDTDARDEVLTRWQAWLPGDPDVLATDRIVWQSDTYEINGQPESWDFAGAQHKVLSLTRSTG